MPIENESRQKPIVIGVTSSDELIRKTADEAIAVYTEKDMAYLRS